MLKLENGMCIATDDYYIQHMENGLDELHFTLPLTDPAYRVLQEDMLITETTEKQRYQIKTIGGGRQTAQIGCRLDLREWQRMVFLEFIDPEADSSAIHGYSTHGDRTALEVLTGLVPEGWTAAERTPGAEKRTIQMQGPTPLEVAEQLQQTFGCALRFDTAEKKAVIWWPGAETPSCAFAVETVNLRRPPEFKGRSADRYTRLYPLGKDGLNIGAVNGGKTYVENTEYARSLGHADEIICAVWKDERYTDASSLLEDARKRVDAASWPERNWKLDVADLHRLNPEKWPDMGLSLFTVLKLIDGAKGFRANVQVLEDRVYPYYPEKNQITVSTVTRSVQRTVRALYRQINDPNSEFYQRLNAGQEGK